MTEPTDPLYDDAYLRGVALGFPQGDTRRWTLCRIADRIEAASQPAEPLYDGLTLDQVKERLAALGADDLRGLVVSLLIQQRIAERAFAATQG